MEDHLKKLDFFPMLTGITPKDMDELFAFPVVMGKSPKKHQFSADPASLEVEHWNSNPIDAGSNPTTTGGFGFFFFSIFFLFQYKNPNGPKALSNLRFSSLSNVFLASFLMGD